MEELLLFNKFFPLVDTCLSCEYIAGQSCAMVPRSPDGDFLSPVFLASCVQHVSDLYSKFALRPHHGGGGSIVAIQSPTAELRRGKEEKEEEGEEEARNHRAKI